MFIWIASTHKKSGERFYIKINKANLETSIINQMWETKWFCFASCLFFFSVDFIQNTNATGQSKSFWIFSMRKWMNAHKHFCNSRSIQNKNKAKQHSALKYYSSARVRHENICAWFFFCFKAKLYLIALMHAVFSWFTFIPRQSNHSCHPHPLCTSHKSELNNV